MASTLTANEESQLLQTIEMFEFIVSQPGNPDCQSLDILKEAYIKLGREKDVVNTSKRIAQAYVQLGALSSAILEYETILQRFPDDKDVIQALAEIENRATNMGPTRAAVEPEPVEKPVAPLRMSPGGGPAAPAEVDDGKAQMQKVFVESKLISGTDFSLYWPAPRTSLPAGQISEPFVQVLAEKQLLPLEKSLKLLCEKSRSGYLGIEKYDVDIELSRSFPKEICFRWCVLPFDRMSKTIMVATANPYNKQAARELEEALPQKYGKSRFLWYVVSPIELAKVLRKVCR